LRSGCFAGIYEFVAYADGINDTPITINGRFDDRDFVRYGVDVEDAEEEVDAAFCRGDDVRYLVTIRAVEAYNLV
jgi:hypothetical protein